MVWRSIVGRFVLLAVVLAALVPIAHAATPSAPVRASDANWYDGFDKAGPIDTNNTQVRGPVYAYAFRGDDVYIGGLFDFTIDGVRLRNIARWNRATNTWSRLGAGLNGNVSAMLISGDDLFVSGGFTTANEKPASRIARWNLTTDTWFSMNGGSIQGSIQTLAAIGDDIYAGGTIGALNGGIANNLIRWNRTTATWSTVGAGTNGSVNALTVFDDVLYVGGAFTTAGGIAAARIARYDPASASWSAFGDGISGGREPVVNAVTVTPERVYVGGVFTTAGGVAAANVAYWDTAAAQWQPLGDGVQGIVYALDTADDEVYVGGNFRVVRQPTLQHVVRWQRDSATWSALGNAEVPNPVLGPAQTVVVNGDEVYAGGNLQVRISRYTTTNYAARWNRTTGAWRAFSPVVDIPFDYNAPNDNVNQMLVVGDDVYIVGGFANVGIYETRGIARWNRVTRTWSSVGGGLTSNNATARNIRRDGDYLYVVGAFNAAGDVAAVNVARWNLVTQTWSNVPGLSSYDINDLAFDDQYIYFVETNTLSRWNKTTQTVEALGRRFGGSTVSSIALLGDDVYVGGAFGGFDDTDALYVARWNKTTRQWFPLARGVSNPPNDIVAHDGAIYASGVVNASGLAINGVAKWDPALERWSAVLRQSNAGALTFVGDDMYVRFTDPLFPSGQSVLRYNLADGSQTALGSGTNGQIRDIAVADGDVFVGGRFTTAGGKPSFNIGYYQSEATPQRTYLPLVRR